jgi:hypothetical protein
VRGASLVRRPLLWTLELVELPGDLTAISELCGGRTAVRRPDVSRNSSEPRSTAPDNWLQRWKPVEPRSPIGQKHPSHAGNVISGRCRIVSSSLCAQSQTLPITVFFVMQRRRPISIALRPSSQGAPARDVVIFPDACRLWRHSTLRCRGLPIAMLAGTPQADLTSGRF